MTRKIRTTAVIIGLYAAGVFLLNLIIKAGCYIFLFLLTI